MSIELEYTGTKQDLGTVRKVWKTREIDVMDLHPEFIKSVFEEWYYYKENEYDEDE